MVQCVQVAADRGAQTRPARTSPRRSGPFRLSRARCARAGTRSSAPGPTGPSGRPPAPGTRRRSAAAPAAAGPRPFRSAPRWNGNEAGFGNAVNNGMTWAAKAFRPLNQIMDLVFVKQRGTAGSGLQTCPGLQPTSTTLDLAAISAAARRCLASASRDPRHDTTTSAVRDLDQVRQALGYDTINIYGPSYGVTMGLAYLQRYGSHVRTAVLDSGSLLSVPSTSRAPCTTSRSSTRSPAGAPPPPPAPGPTPRRRPGRHPGPAERPPGPRHPARTRRPAPDSRLASQRTPARLIPESPKHPGFDVIWVGFDTSATIRLRSPSRSPPDASHDAFSSSLTTTVFSQPSMRRFKASLRRATPKGPDPSSPAQHRIRTRPTSAPPRAQDTLWNPTDARIGERPPQMGHQRVEQRLPYFLLLGGQASQRGPMQAERPSLYRHHDNSTARPRPGRE